MNTVRIFDGARYTVDSTGNGLGYTLTRKSDGAQVWFQGDGASDFAECFDAACGIERAFDDYSCLLDEDAEATAFNDAWRYDDCQPDSVPFAVE